MAGLQQKLWLVGTWPVLQKENNKIPNFKTGNNFETISVLLILASQRIEDVLGWDGHEGDSSVTKRGAKPSLVESCILAWVTGLIWSEIKQLWDVGLKEYINDMWNVVDFITNSLYVATIGLRTVAYFDVRHQSYWWHKGRFTLCYNVLLCVTLSYFMLHCVTLCQVLYEKELGVNTVSLPRENWDTWDPTLISEVRALSIWWRVTTKCFRDSSLPPTSSPPSSWSTSSLSTRTWGPSRSAQGPSGETLSRIFLGVAQSNGDRHHEVHIPLPPGSVRLLLWYEPAAVVLRWPGEAGLHGGPQSSLQQPDHHARRVRQEEQQGETPGPPAHRVQDFLTDGLRERWPDYDWDQPLSRL